MTLTIDQVFQIPEDVSALGFVVKLNDKDTSDEQLVHDYVITPGVRDDLTNVMTSLRDHVHEKREDIGYFVHGSFGSGKSHFMSLLGHLLEDRDFAWSKDDPLVRKLSVHHREWIADQRFLVVRENLLSASTGDAGFDRLIYQATNDALRAHDKEPFEFLNVKAVLEEAQREAERYGDEFFDQLAKGGIVPDRSAFQQLLEGPPEDREGLARRYLDFQGRDASQAGFSPAWGEGLLRLSEHVQQQGFGGITFLIDEMLLWLSGLSEHEFKAALNQLNVMVDYSGGRRAVPIALFVARQRRFSEFFPDLADHEQVHDHLDHHSGRFEQITLEDVDLRHIVNRRILRPHPAHADTLEQFLDSLAEQQQKVLPAILQGADERYLRDVYPFHPALIEMLIDISSLLQRSRTALRLLYEMLIKHRTLELGHFLPVGWAFELIFTSEGTVGEHRRSKLQAIQRLYYQNIAPAIERIASAEDSDLTPQRRTALDAIVKTALLAEVSGRLKGGGMTVERLVRLNDVEVTGIMDSGRIAFAHRDLLELSRLVPAVQLSGAKGEAIVSFVLEGADFAAILQRAKSKVDNSARRFRTFYGVFTDLLGVSGQREFGPGQKNEGPFRIGWRGTERTGSVHIGNIREMPYAKFRVSEGEFRLLVDYPWDQAGHTVEEDRQRIYQVHKAEGAQHTICWLPRHLSPRELELMLDLAAAEFITTAAGKDELLGNLGEMDRRQVIEIAVDRARTFRRELAAVLTRAYRDEGEAHALISDVSEGVPNPDLADNLVHFARELMDRRFPQHPQFDMRPTTQALTELLDWMVQAAEAGEGRAAFDDRAKRVLQGIGIPLDIVNLGQTNGKLKTESRYMRDVLDRVDQASVTWQPIDNALYESYGLTPEVRNLFLVFAARSRSYRALQQTTGDPIQLNVQARPYTDLRLERAELLSVAGWGDVNDLARMLLGIDRSPGSRTLTAQDELASRVREAGHARRDTLQRIHGRLVNLKDELEAANPQPDWDRLVELQTAIKELAPVAQDNDSYELLSRILDAWRNEERHHFRAVVQRAPVIEDALEWLQESSVRLMLRGLDHSDAVRSHVLSLAELLAASDSDRQLSKTPIEAWNKRAVELIEMIIEPPEQDPPKESFSERVVMTADTGDGLEGAFERAAQQALKAVRVADAQGPFEIELTIRGHKHES